MYDQLQIPDSEPNWGVGVYLHEIKKSSETKSNSTPDVGDV